MEMLNEVLIMYTMYFMIIFTDFVPETVVKFNAGYFICGLITLYLVFCLAFIVRDTCRVARFKCLYYCSKKNMLEEQKSQKETRE